MDVNSCDPGTDALEGPWSVMPAVEPAIYRPHDHNNLPGIMSD